MKKDDKQAADLYDLPQLRAKIPQQDFLHIPEARRLGGWAAGWAGAR